MRQRRVLPPRPHAWRRCAPLGWMRRRTRSKTRGRACASGARQKRKRRARGPRPRVARRAPRSNGLVGVRPPRAAGRVLPGGACASVDSLVNTAAASHDTLLWLSGPSNRFLFFTITRLCRIASPLSSNCSLRCSEITALHSCCGLLIKRDIATLSQCWAKALVAAQRRGRPGRPSPQRQA